MIYSISALISALFIAWVLLAKVDFFYPELYASLEINKTITQYGPQNKYKKGFEYTTDEQRFALFSNLVKEIHQGGSGLEELSYRINHQTISLLTTAEIIHLKDVAKLVRVLTMVGIISLFIWALLSFYYIKRKQQLPALKSQLISLLVLTSLVCGAIFLIGFVKVFYWLHEFIFPENHQWFFYYQESLMSMLMKAPDIFPPISLMLLVLAVFCFVLLNLGARLALTKRNSI